MKASAGGMAGLALAGVTGRAVAQTEVRHVQTAQSPIATGVWAGDTYYLSGQLADPVTPADKAKGTAAVYPTDTKAQAASVFAKIQKALQTQGLDMKDVVKMTVFLGPDPATGKLDFAGMQSVYPAQQAGAISVPGGGARGPLGAVGDRGHCGEGQVEQPRPNGRPLI